MRAGLAALLCAVLIAGCGDSAKPRKTPTAVIGNVKLPPGEFGRNVVRVGGMSPADVAGAAALAMFSAEQPPTGWILVRDDDWRDTVLAAQFAAGPVYAGLLAVDPDYLPTAAVDVLKRIRPRAFPKAKGLQGLVVGGATPNLFGDVDELGIKMSLLKARTPEQLALQTVPYRGGFSGAYSDSVIIVSNADRDYALPAAAWSAYSGDTLAFVDRDEIPQATRDLLVQRQKLRIEKPSIYIVGPPSSVSAGVAAQLRRYGPVKRISGNTPADVSVAFARYHDPDTGFGWGLEGGPTSVSLVNRAQWGNAIAAFSYAARGPQAPLLLLDSGDKLSPAVAGYLEDLGRRGHAQAYAFGDGRSISTPLLRKVDAMLGGRNA